MLAIPPVKPVKSGRRPEQPLFTIHEGTNNVLAVRLKGKPEIKTCVISFSRYGDALMMGRLIERHQKIHNEWPDFNFEDNQNDNILRLVANDDETGFLKELAIVEWSNLDEASSFCALHFMDLMKMRNIRQKSGGSFQLQGDIYHLALKTNDVQKRLDHIFDIENRNNN